MEEEYAHLNRTETHRLRVCLCDCASFIVNSVDDFCYGNVIETVCDQCETDNHIYKNSRTNTQLNGTPYTPNNFN